MSRTERAKNQIQINTERAKNYIENYLSEKFGIQCSGDDELYRALALSLLVGEDGVVCRSGNAVKLKDLQIRLTLELAEQK